MSAFVNSAPRPKRPRTAVLALCFALLPLVAGCAGTIRNSLLTPQNDAESYGYVEKRVADATYQITYSGPEVMTDNTVPSLVAVAAERAKQTALDLATWRAAQLSLDKGFAAFAITASQSDLKQVIVGHDYRDQGNSVYENIHATALGYNSAIFFRPQATITVELHKTKSGDALDAQATAQKMKDQYADAAARPIAPNTYYYFGPSAIVHEVSEGGKARAPAPAAAPGPHSEHPPYAGAAY